MSSTIAIAAATTANIAAANANAQAAAAHRAQCATWMPTYHHESATIETQKAYAACVRATTPTDMPTGAEAIALKVAILIVIGAACVGAVLGWLDRFDGGFVTAGLFSLMGAAVSGIALMCIYGVYLGLSYVFS